MFNNKTVNAIGLAVMAGLTIINIILIVDSKRKMKKTVNQYVKTRNEIGNVKSVVNELSKQKQEGS